jgi:hypothetical protein
LPAFVAIAGFTYECYQLSLKRIYYTNLQPETNHSNDFLPYCLQLRIPVESGQHSGGKKATVPMGKRSAFRFDCGQHSDEKGQCTMRE